ncbi:MAG: chitobiase/beta-hexosaminidase C-terminal domain-containing protein [Candidatus Doudnabacteria bacterium]|nr:chitobiase/beta-hexosaminidase C-terminal domain-containing protein [Candidatus Doudnabacteria bacterium]
MKIFRIKLLLATAFLFLGMGIKAVLADEVTGNLSTGLNSTVGTTVNGVVISPPTANPAAGTYKGTQTVTLTADGSTSIYYTTDNSAPTCSAGLPYNGAISVTASVTIQAISCYPGSVSSTVASYGYTINSSQSLATSGGGGGGGAYYSVIIAKSGDGTGNVTANGSLCSGSCAFIAGTSVTLTAASESGSSFGGWTGDCTGSTKTCALVLNGNKNVETSFIKGQVLGESISTAHPNGTLVIDGKTVSLIAGGQIHGFRDPQEFASYGYKFSQTVPINEADKLLPAGDIMKAMTGTLALDTSDNRTIYMVGQQYSKRGFVSMQVFADLGYTKVSSLVRGMFKINLSDYPAGDPVASSTAAHPEGALVLDGTGTVWWVLDGQRSGFESLTVFNTYGFTFDRVVPANSADMALPVGPTVKLRDGTLVSDGVITYIISDGQKLPFADSAAMVSRGYDVKNAVSADLAGYTAGPNLN